MQNRGNLNFATSTTPAAHMERPIQDDAKADRRLVSSFGGDDVSQIRPLRAPGAGGGVVGASYDVIKVPLLEDIQEGSSRESNSDDYTRASSGGKSRRFSAVASK